jgi:hypothetical protein
MKTLKYLEVFFEEKQLPYEMWEIEHKEEMHFIDTDFVITLIQEAPASEQEQIAAQLRKMDFVNANINHFLKYLAESYIKVKY